MSQWMPWEKMDISEKELFRQLCEKNPIILSREKINEEISYRKQNGIEIDDILKFRGMIFRPITIQDAEKIYRKIFLNYFLKNNSKEKKTSQMNELQKRNRILYNKCLNFIISSNTRSENISGYYRQNIRWKGYTLDWKDDCGIIQMEEFAPFVLKELDLGFSCFYCGNPLENERFAFDHYYPLSQGGKNRVDNICLSCLECNTKKYASDPHDILLKLKKIEKYGQQELLFFFPNLIK